MTITKQTQALLQQLLDTGLYGQSIEEVIERLICQQLQQLIKDRVLSQPAMPAPGGPRCMHCGSPRINDISGMGPPEFQCLDCNRNFGL